MPLRTKPRSATSSPEHSDDNQVTESSESEGNAPESDDEKTSHVRESTQRFRLENRFKLDRESRPMNGGNPIYSTAPRPTPQRDHTTSSRRVHKPAPYMPPPPPIREQPLVPMVRGYPAPVPSGPATNPSTPHPARQQPASFSYPHAPVGNTTIPVLPHMQDESGDHQANMSAPHAYPSQPHTPGYYPPSQENPFSSIPYQPRPAPHYPSYGAINSNQQYFVPPPPPPPQEEPTPQKSPSPPPVDLERLRLEAELKAFKAMEEKARAAEKQRALEADIRKDVEDAFRRRMEDMRLAQEEAKKEIEKAKAEAEQAARERFEAERKAEEERQRQHAEAMKLAEARAWKQFEAQMKATEEKRMRENEERKLAEEAMQVRLEHAIKAEAEARAAAEKRAAEEAEHLRQFEEDAKRIADANVAARLEEEKVAAAKQAVADAAAEAAAEELLRTVEKETKQAIADAARKADEDAKAAAELKREIEENAKQEFLAEAAKKAENEENIAKAERKLLKAPGDSENLEYQEHQRRSDIIRIRPLEAHVDARMALESRDVFESDWQRTVEENMRMKVKLDALAEAEARTERQKEFERMEKFVKRVMMKHAEELACLSKSILLEFKAEMRGIFDSFSATTMHPQSSTVPIQPASLLGQAEKTGLPSSRSGGDAKDSGLMYPSAVSTPIVDLSAIDDRFATYTMPVPDAPTPPVPPPGPPPNHYHPYNEPSIQRMHYDQYSGPPHDQRRHSTQGDEATEALARRVADILIERFEERKYLDSSSRDSTSSPYSSGQSSRSSYRPSSSTSQGRTMRRQRVPSRPPFWAQEGAHIFAPRPMPADMHNPLGGPLGHGNIAQSLEASASQTGTSPLLTPNTSSEAAAYNKPANETIAKSDINASIYETKETSPFDMRATVEDDDEDPKLELTKVITRTETLVSEQTPLPCTSSGSSVEINSMREMGAPEIVPASKFGARANISSDSCIVLNLEDERIPENTEPPKVEETRRPSPIAVEETKIAISRPEPEMTSSWFDTGVYGHWLPFGVV